MDVVGRATQEAKAGGWGERSGRFRDSLYGDSKGKECDTQHIQFSLDAS